MIGAFEPRRAIPAMKKDKQKVIDEVWDDARVRSFLDKDVPRQATAPFPGDPDFYVLRNAYQSMRAEDFCRFLDFYTADGRDVRARDNKGRTLAEIIAGHANSGRFVELLNAH